jgi:hypothetical protein
MRGREPYDESRERGADRAPISRRNHELPSAAGHRHRASQGHAPRSGGSVCGQGSSLRPVCPARPPVRNRSAGRGRPARPQDRAPLIRGSYNLTEIGRIKSGALLCRVAGGCAAREDAVRPVPGAAGLPGRGPAARRAVRGLGRRAVLAGRDHRGQEGARAPAEVGPGGITELTGPGPASIRSRLGHGRNLSGSGWLGRASGRRQHGAPSSRATGFSAAGPRGLRRAGPGRAGR